MVYGLDDVDAHGGANIKAAGSYDHLANPSALLACHTNAMCIATPEAQAQRRAVARMIYDGDQAGYIGMCTGTLLNNTKDDKTPYFATAWHCISTPEKAASLETFWFFHASDCANPTTINTTGERPRTSWEGGADVLYTESRTDFTLLKLRNPENMPAGVLFSGSFIGVNTLNTAVTGIHHPRGALQKYSAGAVTGYESCVITGTSALCQSSNRENSHMLVVDWTDGLTQQGSSGSGLLRSFDGKNYLIGVLNSGPLNASCDPGADKFGMYGRFDKAYQMGNLAQWLRPQ